MTKNNFNIENNKYFLYNKSLNIRISEEELKGKNMSDLSDFLTDYQLIKLHTKECVFILKKSFLGIFKLKLHLYLNEDTVYDYTIRKEISI